MQQTIGDAPIGEMDEDLDKAHIHSNQQDFDATVEHLQSK